MLSLFLTGISACCAAVDWEATKPAQLGVAERAYWESMVKLGEQLTHRQFASDIVLTSNEEKANRYLVGRARALTLSYQASNHVPFALPFLKVKSDIENTEIFHWLRRMPKGGALHLHGSSAGRVDWVITNALRRSDAYINWPSDTDPGRGKMAFGTETDVRSRTGSTNYVQAIALRRELHARGKSLDEEMRFLLQMTEGPNGSTGWKRFNECFGLIGDLATYRPVALDYLQDTMEFLCAEGAYLVELRISKGRFFEGTNDWSDADFLQQFNVIRDRVRAKHSEFDLKLILCDWRGSEPSALRSAIAPIQEMKAQFPDLIVGYDLIGEEDADRTPPTADYAMDLISLQRTVPGLNLYLHDGESNWANDTNLIAAVLLEPKRIGHAFNMFRFPNLQEYMIDRRIVVEVCPISNQSLNLISDLRAHPASGYLNRGIQAVLGNDDPLIMGNDGLTYDFWMAFVGWDLDLRALKMLARNSLEYSSLSGPAKATALENWNSRWDAWIGELVAATDAARQ